jgi:hypothetical protein
MAHAHSLTPQTIVLTQQKLGPQHPFGVANDSSLRPPVKAAQVTISWGDSVLSVLHLNPVRTITLGEPGSDGKASDYLLPSEKLGLSCWPLLRVEGDSTELCVPRAATGTLVDNQGRSTLISEIWPSLRSDPNGTDARIVELCHAMRAHLLVGGFIIDVAAIEPMAAAKRSVGDGLERPVLAAFASSLFSVGGLLATLAYFVPPMGFTDDEVLDEDQLRTIQQYLVATQERERAASETEVTPAPEPGERAGESGHRSPGNEGQTGSLTSVNRQGRLGVFGPADTVNPQLAREKAIDAARHFGMVDLLGALNSGTRGGAIASPWGEVNPVGRDAMDADGQMWGDTLGESRGFGGLGLSGTGEGGGCRGPNCGKGIGMDEVGTIGGGFGVCDPTKGPCDGFGRGGGRGNLGSHKTRVPVLHPSNTIVSGRLPPEVIQRVVRQNFGRFRFCYEQGLTRNPNLEGRVSVRFVIGRDGAVSNVADGGSNLPDAAVHSCVLQSFYALGFPSPEAGIVTVSYPIQFQPG